MKTKVALCSFFLAAMPALGAKTSADISSQARSLRFGAIVVDTHDDTTQRLLDPAFDLGVRYMTLTHSVNTSWADSSGAKPAHDGLTELGRKVVAEMNRLGMIVGISHVSDKAFHDVLALSQAPVFASHSSCRADSFHRPTGTRTRRTTRASRRKSAPRPRSAVGATLRAARTSRLFGWSASTSPPADCRGWTGRASSTTSTTP